MGKLLAGMLLVMVAGLGLVSAAEAAKIPPSAECSVLYKKLNKEYEAAIDEVDSVAAEKKLAREFADALLEAGCISDTEPLIEKFEPKPFMPKCVEAARAADRFWRKASGRLETLNRAYLLQGKRFMARVNRLNRRIAFASARGASRARIRSLRQTLRKVHRTDRRRSNRFYRRAEAIAWPRIDATALVYLELVSLKCMAPASLFEDETRGPAARVVRKHGLLVFISFYLLSQRDDRSGDASGSSNLGSAAAELPFEVNPGTLAVLP